jgi:multiple sugar transport system permease protein
MAAVPTRAREGGGARVNRPGSAATRRRHTLAAWLFALPFLALFAVFMAGPVLASLTMSFTDFTSRDLRTPLAVNLVGLENYTRLLSDERFLRSAVNTVYFVAVGIPLTMVLALAVAVALNSGVNRFRTFFRVGFYIPVVTSIVAVAVVWRFILQPDSGLLNQVLGWVGIDGPHWLQSTTWAMPSLIVMAAWRNMGTLMVIFLAGLQTIPRDLHEAAMVDGAGAWRRFRSITLPLLRPTLLLGAVLTGVGYLQFFEEPFVMTKGGPLDRTLSTAFFTYNQFGFGNYSYAAAASYLLFLAIVVLTLVQFRLLRSRT